MSLVFRMGMSAWSARVLATWRQKGAKRRQLCWEIWRRWEYPTTVFVAYTWTIANWQIRTQLREHSLCDYFYDNTVFLKKIPIMTWLNARNTFGCLVVINKSLRRSFGAVWCLNTKTEASWLLLWPIAARADRQINQSQFECLLSAGKCMWSGRCWFGFLAGKRVWSGRY